MTPLVSLRSAAVSFGDVRAKLTSIPTVATKNRSGVHGYPGTR